MKVLLLFAVLLVCFACAYAITCTACMEMISDDPNFQPPADPSAASCSGNPGETVCDESVSSCMTIMTTMEFTRDASSLTLTQTNRDCAPPAGLPAGDTCADQTTIDVFKANIPDPASLFPPELGLTFENLDISICVCDSADTCTPPSPVTDAASQPEPEPTANADGKGYAITCTTCMEMTSDDPNFQPPADPSAASCSDNLGETVCDEGVRSCVTMMTTMEFTRDASSLTLTQTHRDCAPPAGLPAGDTCADQTTVDMLTANVPDPATLFPPELGLTFENLDVSICVCDSADRCTPPSPATDARPQPEPVPTANADGQEPRTPKPAPSCTITDIRLVDGNTEVEGRVEIMYRGQWGTVCDDDWDMDDALVVCRMLGFDGASQAVVSAQFGQGSGPIILDDVMCLGNEATLADCPHPPFGQHNCDHSKDAGVACFTIVPTTAPTATEPTITGIRLVGSTSANEGRVEILYNGEWGTICDDSWDLPDAVVTCRMLGFEGASLATTQAQFGRGSGDIWLDEVRCSGEEASLAECSHREFGEHNCWHGEDAGVVCVSRPTTTTASTIRITTTTATTTSATTQATTQVPSIDGLRLVGGSSDNEGRVEILYNGQWGTVCDDLWGLADASVVCRLLEFDGASEAPGFARFGQGSDPIWLDNVRCTGNETHLAYCQHSSFGQHNCQHDEDAGVVCFTTKPTTTPTPPTPSIDGIRLTGGIVDNEGIVEILVNGQWGTVCGNYWSYDDARVVCRMMGYTGAQQAVGSSRFRQASGPIHIHNVLCWGNEKSLIDCGGDLFGPNNCTHSQDAGVICYPWNLDQTTTLAATTTTPPPSTTPTPRQVRLVGGNLPFMGRVEVSNSYGHWGSICDYDWTRRDANVVCRMLGYDGASSYSNNAEYGESRGRIHLDDVTCVGWENNIASCQLHDYSGWGCDKDQEVGVRCNVPEPSEFEIRLVGGSNPWEGRVELLYLGQWGTICSSFWGKNDGDVACRMLGYSGAYEAISPTGALYPTPFGEGTGTILLSDFRCTGTEENLADCSHSGWGDHNCYHYQDAGLVCNSPDPDSVVVRLVNGSSRAEGRVEVLYEGEFGTVCDDSWDIYDAAVVCRMLGYEGASEAPGYARFGQGSGDIVLDDVVCLGSENNIASCEHRRWGTNNCAHTEDAGVICTGELKLPVRLVNGNSANEGRVEIFRYGAWGSVCDDWWDINDGNVVCRMLGYARAERIWWGTNYGPGSGKILLDNVECSGSEATLDDCVHPPWGVHDCNHYEDAGVVCVN